MIELLLALLLGNGPAQAERAYEAGEFAEALALYQAALEEPGAAEGSLLYDMGNCAFRLGRLAEAALFYRRALVRMPRDEDAEHNLRLAERRLGLEAPLGVPLSALAVRATDALAPGLLLALAAALETIGLLGVVFLRRRRAAQLSAALLLLLALAAAGRLAERRWFPGPPEAVVLSAEIALRAEPHAEVPAILRLKAGETVRVLERSDRWSRVLHAHGGGWTESTGLGLVE